MSLGIKGEARSHQLVTTYGVGSIIALGDESFMVAGIDFWKVDGPSVFEPRLQRELGVEGFVPPPASGDDHRRDVPVVRFPRMQSCSSCNRLARHDQFTQPENNRCEACGELLVPSRFIVACQNGHIDDFPYFRWVHAGGSPDSMDHELHLGATGMTSSLRDVLISCSCGKQMTMDGTFRADALRNIARCTGQRPWLRATPEECVLVPRTLQRGASNVWYPNIRSALSIPPWSDALYKVMDRNWNLIQYLDEDALPSAMKGPALKSGFSVEELVAAALRRRSELDDEPAGLDALRKEEHAALVHGRPETADGQDFVCEGVDIDGVHLDEYFISVMAVPRLREVRALDSFARVLPPSPADGPERRAAIFEKDPSWLPAIEVSGEGIFLELDPDRVRRWEQDEQVVARYAVVDSRYRKRFEAHKQEPNRTIAPRLVLLHSLAHLLISQWSLECGYPAAALRERIYSGDAMAGLLIYTATTDSAGSLGGVVALSEPARLHAALRQALDRATWCSSDPLCSEGEGAGVDALNLAACHACLLVPEVSCEEMNLLLDRASIIDTPGAPAIGFFEPRYQ